MKRGFEKGSFIQGKGKGAKLLNWLISTIGALLFLYILSNVLLGGGLEHIRKKEEARKTEAITRTQEGGKEDDQERGGIEK